MRSKGTASSSDTIIAMIVFVPVPWSAAAMFSLALASERRETITVVGGPDSILHRHAAMPTPRLTCEASFDLLRFSSQPNASAPAVRHCASVSLVYRLPLVWL